MQLLKKVAIAALSAGVLFSGVSNSEDQQEMDGKEPAVAGQTNGNVQNIIYMIPEGSETDSLLNAAEKAQKATDFVSMSTFNNETEELSLAEMTVAAINALREDQDGFFLTVEGSPNVHATTAFDEAVEAAQTFAEMDGQTLVVVADDAKTGSFLAEQLDANRSNIPEVVRAYTGIELTNEEIHAIWQAEDTASAINKTINNRTLIGWTSTAYTGTDLPIYAFGPKSQNFVGVLDIGETQQIIAEAMEVELDN